MAKRKKMSKGLTLFLAIVFFLVGCLSGFVGCYQLEFADRGSSHDHSSDDDDDGTKVVVSNDLEIHFLELGNKYTGDCVYIKAGENDILIDAGSRTSSISTIKEYIDKEVTDGKIEYVIVTHAHQDHYAGFATSENTDSLFDLYEFEVIIDFSRIENGKEDGTMYKNYIRERNAEIAAGATHYTAEECMLQKKNIFELGNNTELEILDSYFYYNVSGDENNHSVCAMINQGDRHFLFTGDLEKEGEEKLVQMNDLPQVELYKAGHHGSKTSSNDVLLSVIKPKIVCVCCCAGSPEYTDAPENQFPTQAFIDRISKYTSRVYVTTLVTDYKNSKFVSMNGNIVVKSSKAGITVKGSTSDTMLKDSTWFKENRVCPAAWK